MSKIYVKQIFFLNSTYKCLLLKCTKTINFNTSNFNVMQQVIYFILFFFFYLRRYEFII